MPAPTASTIAALLALAGATATPRLLAQDGPVLHAVCADLTTAEATGLQWLAQQCLPRQNGFPADLRPGQPLALELSAAGLRMAAATAAPPLGAAMAGTVRFATGQQVLWSCAADGTEDWFVPLDLHVPGPWQRLLQQLHADVLDTPRQLDLAVLVGHLTTGAADGDPRASRLHLGAAACADVTWTAWRTEQHLRVRGRSAGGLLLPALLVHLALGDATNKISRLPLRAFTARDGDREEATRQLLRSPGDDATQTLRALLHGDDLLRLVAIDALVRRGEAAELPRIVAAAAPGKPLTTLAAYDAVRSLFARADPLDRQRTRAAIARSQDQQLRSLDCDSLLPQPGRTLIDDGSGRARALVLLCLVGVAMFGLWSRERARLTPQP